MIKIAIVGLGYVGLPLALKFAENGADVLGLDIDSNKVDSLMSGRSYIGHIDADRISALVASGRFKASTDFTRVRGRDAVILCVPTPLNKNREPDISYILNTGAAIGPHLDRGTLVALESTTYPGTTDTDLRRVLEETSGLKAGDDFHLAYSPEREDPGNADSKVERIPKIIGGLTPACRDRAIAVYSIAIEKLVPVADCRTAEAAKLLENIFRSVNIALVNELKVVYAAMGINIWDVIEAAKTKPFGFMPFYPGPGLGGHCIPIDPFYLTWKAREYGKNTRFIELAGEINTAMPEYVIQRATDALNDGGKPLRGSHILIVGLAYKADVDDLRESPAFHLLEGLQARGAEVAYHDPHIPEVKPTREHGHWTGVRSIEWTPDNLASYDLAIICTAHRAVKHEDLLHHCAAVLDTRNALAGFSGKSRVYQA